MVPVEYVIADAVFLRAKPGLEDDFLGALRAERLLRRLYAHEWCHFPIICDLIQIAQLVTPIFLEAYGENDHD